MYMFTLTHLGLILIALAWFIQLVTKRRELNVIFLFFYVLGVMMLVAEAVMMRRTVFAGLNLTSAILAFLIFAQQGKRK